MQRRSTLVTLYPAMQRARCGTVLVMVLLFTAAALFAVPGAAPTAFGSSAISQPAPLIWVTPPLETKTLPPRITAVAFDPATPGTGLASTFNADGDILRTIDHGRTWAPLSSWSGTPGFNFHVSWGEQPGVYYAWGSQSVAKTTTSGDSWTEFTYPDSCGSIFTLAVHPSQPSTLYIGTSFGFAWSTTGGQTWEHCFAGGPIADAIGVGVDQPDVVFAGLAYNNGGGVQRSPDRGQTWAVVNTGLPQTTNGGSNTESITQLIVDPQNANSVFALTGIGAVYTTTNGGAQWTVLNQGIEAVQLRWLARDQATATLFGVSDDHVYILASGASSWQLRPSFPIPQPASFPVPPRLALDPTDPERLVVFHDYGIYVGVPTRGQVLVPLIQRF